MAYIANGTFFGCLYGCSSQAKVALFPRETLDNIWRCVSVVTTGELLLLTGRGQGAAGTPQAQRKTLPFRSAEFSGPKSQ